MKLSSRDESRRCRFVMASEMVKCRLEIEMQGAMTERRQVDQRRAVMNRLQGKSQIDGDSGGAAAAFGVHDREYFSA